MRFASRLPARFPSRFPSPRARGFTLLELAAAIGVMAILASVAVTGGGAALDRARSSRAVADLKIVVASLREYQSDVGVFPSAREDLANRPADAPRWRGPYLERWPQGLGADPAAVWSYGTGTWFDGRPSWGLAICSAGGLDPELIARIDRASDDGDTATGAVRLDNNCLRVYVGHDP